MPMNILSTGLAGIQRGMDAFQSAAKNVVDSGFKPEGADIKSLTENMVSMKQSEVMVKAGIKVLEAGSSMLGSIIDIKA